MSFGIYDAAVPIFLNGLSDMPAWLDKALAEGKSESELMAARLAPDMLPLTAQFQIASDAAKGAVARLAGIEAPSMPDTEASFDALKARCEATIAFIRSVPAQAFSGAESREITLTFRGGVGYRLSGAAFLTGFALPNFLFHTATAYAILRHQGVGVGKADYLMHMGPPIQIEA
ncbi:MAG: DUF1993 domain-containing protein [Alphaproteobacteria bacterium]|jgi:hypothetical protein|nr:DUF1993 domain-containing protein [Alphaproteobacteria bacterium]